MRAWVARAALAVLTGLLAWLLVETSNSADGSGERTEQLRRRLEATPPATVDQVEELGKQVAKLPSELPTPRVVVTTVPGPTGQPGPAGPSGPQGTAGAPGTTTVRTVTVAPRTPPQPAVRPGPRPTPTVTVTARPPCLAEVAGLCVSR